MDNGDDLSVTGCRSDQPPKLFYFDEQTRSKTASLQTKLLAFAFETRGYAVLPFRRGAAQNWTQNKPKASKIPFTQDKTERILCDERKNNYESRRHDSCKSKSKDRRWNAFPMRRLECADVGPCPDPVRPRTPPRPGVRSERHSARTGAHYSPPGIYLRRYSLSRIEILQAGQNYRATCMR